MTSLHPGKLSLPAGITEQAARAHNIAPAHVQNVEIEEMDPAREVRLDIPVRTRGLAPQGTDPDLDEFCKIVHDTLKSSVTGYIMHLRHNGNLAHHLYWNWAQTPADENKGWTGDTRMHVASVSKLLTAVGVVKLLQTKGLNYDNKIIDYLPAYWSKGSNIDKITFRHLLTHTSGLNGAGSASDYLTMKNKVAAGVSGVGSYAYQNLNFGLCRILMAVINGNIDKDYTTHPLFNEQVWDVATIGSYKDYMQANVFTPAGVADAGFFPEGERALAYQHPHGGQDGWNSGYLSTMSGGAGWRLSMKELLNVMDHVRRKNTIISQATAQYILDNYFGIDQIIDTPAGKLYNKNGLWRNGNRTEQSVAYFWPNGMELALFVNSPIGTQGASLRGLVSDAFTASL
jgi:CubicO group peptidase (beta-lactamase class C family)